MKKTGWKLLSFFLALICLPISLGACSKQPKDDGFAHIVQEGTTSYRIVAGVKDQAGWGAAKYLARELEELTGVAFEVKDDRTSVEDGVFEIRVGKTNRGTSYELQRSLRTNEYVISREGDDVYILGMESDTLTLACDVFLTEILNDSFTVTGEGELRRKSGDYAVSSLQLNGRPVTDYTVLTSSLDDIEVDWSHGLQIATEQLTARTGHVMPTALYDPAEQELPCSPAVVLVPDSGSLGMTEYKIELKGEDIYVSAGATAAAIKVMQTFVSEHMASAAGTLALTVSSKGGDTGMSSAAFSVMSFNVLGNSAEHAPYITSTILEAAPDFVCTQEYYKQADQITTAALADAGYGKLGGTINKISPTALSCSEEDEYYQSYASLNEACYTPIFYKAELWEPIEEDSGSYLFYWKNRYHLSNTKSITYGVFRSKIDGELVLVIGTHFPLMLDTYKDEPEREAIYVGLNNTATSVRWRSGAMEEVLALVEELQEKYPEILTIVAGDFNAKVSEDCLKAMEDTMLSNAYYMASESTRTEGASFHSSYGTAPSPTGQPIDHIYASENAVMVISHQILQSDSVLQASDHCPVLVEFFRK